jgi:putative cell wall-binding protein
MKKVLIIGGASAIAREQQNASHPKELHFFG